MNTTRGFISDPEVLDALRDRADLLAVADAVAATQRAPARRRRVALRAGAIAAVAAAVFVAVATP